MAKMGKVGDFLRNWRVFALWNGLFALSKRLFAGKEGFFAGEEPLVADQEDALAGEEAGLADAPERPAGQEGLLADEEGAFEGAKNTVALRLAGAHNGQRDQQTMARVCRITMTHRACSTMVVQPTTAQPRRNQKDTKWPK